MMTPLERFMTRVDKDGPNGCWLWTGYIDNVGYGRFAVRHAVPVGAHRWLYEQTFGPVPKPLVLDHLCRVRHCVNPVHLEPVTNKENVLRGVLLEVIAANKAARTHCGAGHALDQSNEVIMSDGRRGCRTCQRNRNRKFDGRPATRRRGPKVAVVEHGPSSSLLICGHVIERRYSRRPVHMLCAECDVAPALDGGTR